MGVIFKQIEKIKHPWLLAVSILLITYGLPMLYPTSYEDTLFSWMRIVSSGIAGLLSGCVLHAFAEKFTGADKIAWAIIMAPMYIMIMPHIVNTKVGAYFLLFLGIVLLYELFSGIANLFQNLQEEITKVSGATVVELLIQSLTVAISIIPILEFVLDRI